MTAPHEIVPRLDLEQMPPSLRSALGPRVQRLGYLGEFFQCAAHQPEALQSFVTFTENLRAALPANLTELTALTVATSMGNDYERHQHERLCLAVGLSKDWVREVTALQPRAQPRLSAQEQVAQELVLAMLDRQGHGVAAELEAVLRAIGPSGAIAVMFLVGRYVTHALMVNALRLQPPVPSIFQEAIP